MKKKIIFKMLGVAILLAGLVLAFLAGKGIVEGNRIYDLFRKIRVNVNDVYTEVDENGLDQLKSNYRDAYIVVDQYDTLEKDRIQVYLDDVYTAYGLIDTIEATEHIVSTVKTIGTEKARDSLDMVTAAIKEAEETMKAVTAADVTNVSTYLIDIEEVIENHEDLDEAREELNIRYADLLADAEEGADESGKDIKKQLTNFFNFVFKKAKAMGGKEAVQYISAAVAAVDSPAEEFAHQILQQQILDSEAEGKEGTLEYISEVFRLIEDQGDEHATSYIEHLLDTMEKNDIPDARAYLDQVYEDNDENKVTRAYLDSIFRMIDEHDVEYAKLHCGDICAEASLADAEHAREYLAVLNEIRSESNQNGEESIESLTQLLADIEAAGTMPGIKANRYISMLYTLKADAEDAITDAQENAVKAENSQTEMAAAKDKMDNAQKALNDAKTDEERSNAEEDLATARKAYNKIRTKTDERVIVAAKRKNTAIAFIGQIDQTINGIRIDTDPETRKKTQPLQNDISVLTGKVGLERAKKFTANALKAYEDKTLEIDKLGTDNLSQLEALDGNKISLARNKSGLIMAAVACMIIGIVFLCIRPSEGSTVKLTREEKNAAGSHMGLKTSRMIANSVIHAVLVIISVIWLIPFISIVLQSLRVESTWQVGYIMPVKLGFKNYVDLFASTSNFPKWYVNTFIIALVVAVLQTIIVLCMSYTLSRFRFKIRKPLMKFMLILGMFPGMLSMIILYNVLKDLGLTQANAVPGLILVYVASSGMGYYVSKGFFDTIPKSLDEAARVDGATRAQVLYKIILPLAKPIVIYTVLTAFMGPWGDYVFASYISHNTSKGMNVAVGLYSWLNKDQIASRYTMFCAGGVLVAIPVAILFMCLQRYYVEGVTGGAVKG